MHVPEGWKIKKVGELFNVQLGKMLNKKARETSPQFSYLGNSNVRWGNFDLSDLKKMHFDENDREKFELKKGDILLCEGGEVGRCAVWEKEVTGVYYQKALHRLRAKNHINGYYFQKYMDYIVNSTNLLANYSTRTSIAHLTREKLITLKVLTPPLAEQEKIAEILSTWDHAIEQTERLKANAETHKQALMQQLLTGKKRFPEFEGEWELVTVSDVCEIGRGRVISREEINDNFGVYPVYSSQTLNNGVFGYLNKYDFDEELVTWTTDGVNAGTVFYRTGKFSCTNVCGTLRAKNEKILDLRFLSYALSRVAYKHVSHTLANPKLMNGVMGKVKFHLPLILEQQKIAAVLNRADREIELLAEKLDHLKTEKRALMQQLLTGKRRVKVDG